MATVTGSVHIPHDAVGFAGDCKPGWWLGKEDGITVVHLRCGGCGRHAGTLDDHSIETDGEVKASILCGDCGWHVMGVLEGWTHGYKAAGAKGPG